MTVSSPRAILWEVVQQLVVPVLLLRHRADVFAWVLPETTVRSLAWWLTQSPRIAFTRCESIPRRTPPIIRRQVEHDPSGLV